MTIRNFPSDLSWTPGASATDTTPLSLGTVFALTATAQITGIRYYAPAAVTVAGQLWANTTKVAEITGVSCTTGWNTITFTTPIIGATGVDYTAAVYMSTGTAQYTFVNDKFTDGTNAVAVTVGPATSNTISNGRYSYGVDSIPDQVNGTNGAWYGIDAIIDDLAGGAVVGAVRAQGTGAARVPTVTGTVVTPPAAAGTGTAQAPTVVGTSASINVTAVRAQGTGSAVIPAVDVASSISGGGPATGSGVARPPTIQGGTVSSLPVVVTHGAVTAWLGSGVNVSPDADGYADLIPDVGTVTFTPNAAVLTFPTASPAPLILTPRTVVCTLDSNGYLIGTKTGEQLVRLIAGDWTVSFQLTGVTLPSFKITITGGVTTDLANVMPT